jgi:hypothetical protein
MNAAGYFTTGFVCLGFAAWSMVAAAKRFDAHFPAPANDASGSNGGAAAARFPHGISMTSTALRHGLPELPPRMRALPVDSRGYPVPYFVDWIDGMPDFRVMDSRKLAACVYYKRCWICGEPLGQYKAFVIGPMCAVNRVSAEPPSHIDCAKFAAQACPFLALPKAVRREANMPEETQVSGIMLKRNPGVALVWVTRSFRTVLVDNGVLFDIGEPEQTFWYAEGRLASRAEVMASVESGLPALYELAHADSEAAVLELDTMVARATRFFPPRAAAAHIG